MGSYGFGGRLFRDRNDAGKQLAAKLAPYRGTDAVVFALPRGGVVVGKEVAAALAVPLDLIIARKIGHPGNPEYALCAVTESGRLICDEEDRAVVDPQWFADAVARERQEAARRRERYFAGRPTISVEGKIAILVDDGIATGLTMLAAIEEARSRNPRKIVVAIPVIPPDTAERLASLADEVIAVEIPDFFLGAVGAYYEDFRQVTDDEVIALLHDDPAVLFSLGLFKGLATELLQVPGLLPGEYSMHRFPNEEMQIALETGVIGEPCIVLGSIAPPDDNLLETLLLCHTLKKERAARTTALLPYLAYMRQDKDEPGKSHAVSWISGMAQASGIDEIVTVDIHSLPAKDALALPVTSLSAAPLFAQEIIRLGWEHATLVTPDAGGVARCEAVREIAEISQPIAIVQKQRTPEGVHSTLHGAVNRRAIVIDDILDTGKTLNACCELLQQAGAKEIIVMVTHGLFTGVVWQRLWDLGVIRIYCTDTVPLRAEARLEGVTVLSVVEPIARHLAGRLAAS